jgi:Uma2 family endonuclease
MATAGSVTTTLDQGLERAAPGRGVVLEDIDWDSYEKFLDAVGERRIFLTYDRGRMEIMAPLYDHEWWKSRVGFLLVLLGHELHVDVQPGGSTTLRRQDLQRGLEADDCFYISHAAQVLGPRRLDLTRDPPPDLALEVEMTRSALDRMGIYAALKVPEVWRCDGATIVALRLRPEGEYEQTKESLNFPALPLEDFINFLHQTEGLSHTGLIRPFQEWVRQHVLPRLQQPPAGP